MKLIKETEVIDADGVSTKTASITSITKMPPEPAYIKLYIDDLGRMMGLQESHRSVLIYVAASVGYDGFVTLTLARKARIAATVGVAVKTVDNAISEFVKTGVLRREGRAEYELNPNLFARGDWSQIRERREAFSVYLSYSSANGRSILRTAKLTDQDLLEQIGQQRLVD